MANQITGKILFIGAQETIPSKDGQSKLEKRELVLDASRYDPYTGEKRTNTPSFDFLFDRCSILDSFKVGDLVTVSFMLNGRETVKDGKTHYFTNIIGYKVELYKSYSQTPTRNMVEETPEDEMPF